MDLPRRTVILLGVGTLVGGCSTADGPAAPPSAPPSGRSTTGSASASASPSDSPSASPSTGPSAGPSVAPLPAVRRWEPSGNDRVPDCKVAAVRRVERDHTAADRVVQVIDAQYGGLLPSAASVLVVTRTWRRVGGRVQRGGRTYDVRLRRAGAGWRVDEVLPSRPGRRAPRLTPAQRRVLADDRIDLPPAARADVASGRVHASVLAALAEVSRSYRVGVSVVRSGHPLHVFGTDRLSEHPQGRAFDTWSIDGHAVVDARTPRSLVTGFMHAVAEAGSYNVGGPYLLGAAPQWFSDDTHHDHVHAGFAV